MRAKPIVRIVVAVVLIIVLLVPVAFATMSFFASTPDNLGVHDGKLSPCPNKPNCVCSDSDDPEHVIEPIPFTGPVDAALERLRKVLQQQPRTTIITDEGGYIHAEVHSLIFRFVDDVEFYADPEGGIIQVRSASRSGHSDFGVNRARIETIRTAFEAQGPSTSSTAKSES